MIGLIETMREIRKKIVKDENDRPVAVQIEYEDWLEIERSMKPRSTPRPALQGFAGTIRLGEDPLQYQARVRAEWS